MSIKYNNLEISMWQYLSDTVARYIYIHIPFCRKKCYYCDFFSVPISDFNWSSLSDSYVNSLISEIDLWCSIGLQEVKTIYIGGGTPSILSARRFERLLRHIETRLIFDNNFEFTVEVNPESLTPEKIDVFKRFGVNRISLGVQSFDDEVLVKTGRITRYKDIINSLRIIDRVRIENLNIDLIMGIQDERTFKRDLEMAVGFSPSHISIYMLHLANDTLLAEMVQNGRFEYPENRYFERLYLYTIEFLRDKGYRQYEISNFSLPGYQSLHNTNYWRGNDYLGIGAGSVSTIGKYRIKNPEDVNVYEERIKSGKLPFYVEEVLDTKTRLKEKIMLSLRTTWGLNLKTLKRGLGEEVYRGIADYFSEIKNIGMVNIDDKRINLTPWGFLRYNTILSEVFLRLETGDRKIP